MRLAPPVLLAWQVGLGDRKEVPAWAWPECLAGRGEYLGRVDRRGVPAWAWPECLVGRGEYLAQQVGLAE